MGNQLRIPRCIVTSEQYTSTCIQVQVESLSKCGRCPSCGTVTQGVHSYYERQLLDLPHGEFAVQLRVRVKRFRCQQDTCERQTFAEGVPRLAERYAAFGRHPVACGTSSRRATWLPTCPQTTDAHIVLQYPALTSPPLFSCHEACSHSWHR